MIVYIRKELPKIRTIFKLSIMKKTELLLVEDNIAEATELSLILKKHQYAVTIAKNSSEAIEALQNQYFDVMVIDIMINGKAAGISFAHTLHQHEIDIPYLFLAGVNDKSIFENAKGTKALNYLLKPYDELEILYALELAIETHCRQVNTTSKILTLTSEDFIFVKKRNKIEKVLLNTIYYVEVEEKFCTIITDYSKYLIKISLTKLKKVLPTLFLKQVHRNFLININKIKEIYFEDNLIILDNKDKIPLSKKYKGSFLDNKIIFR
jgi:DNA-binding LytR/AlgR family response regulator